MEKNPEDLETPVSVSVDLQGLRQSENPEDRSFAEMISELSNIRSLIAKLGENYDENKSKITRELMNMIEHRLERMFEFGPRRRSSRKYGRVIPEFLIESRHVKHRGLQFVIAASVFRDTAPWLYEVGMEAYRQIAFGNIDQAKAAADEFRNVAKMTLQHPMFRELSTNDKETHYIVEYLDDLIFHKDPNLFEIQENRDDVPA